MKLQAKEREGSKVRRTYDQAQTPMQRLLTSSILSPQRQQELLRITEAVSPAALAYAARTLTESASSGTLSHLPQNRLHLLLRFRFPCSSVQKKTFLSMGFLIHLHPCSKERARKSSKRPGGLMIGARARTLSRGNGNRLRPGCSLIQNSQAWISFTGWNRSPQDVIDQPRYEPCKGA
jgi:hypothetical protein